MTRHYLITGAGRGIGRGLSRLLLENGHRVFLLDSNAEELSHTSITFAARFPKENHAATVCDLTKHTQIRDAVAKAEAFLGGKLDCLVNNAAYTGSVGSGTTLDDITLEEWNRSIETNLTAPMLVSQACLPMLRRAKGCIVHMSSTRALQAEPHHEAYSATKAGLVGLAQSMAVSLAPEVRCSAVLPGWIYVQNECKEADGKAPGGTEWSEGLSLEDQRWHLTGRVGKVEDIWRAVEYLVENTGVTGAELVVDGGVTRKMVYPD